MLLLGVFSIIYIELLGANVKQRSEILKTRKKKAVAALCPAKHRTKKERLLEFDFF
jgi:hypothetical protein